MATGVYSQTENRGVNATSPSSSRPNGGHVDFDETGREDYEERKKYLTAKYGAHQMKLIRKRLAVEDWVDSQLRQLFDVVSRSSKDEIMGGDIIYGRGTVPI